MIILNVGDWLYWCKQISTIIMKVLAFTVLGVLATTLGFTPTSTFHLPKIRLHDTSGTKALVSDGKKVFEVCFDQNGKVHSILEASNSLVTNARFSKEGTITTVMGSEYHTVYKNDEVLSADRDTVLDVATSESMVVVLRPSLVEFCSLKSNSYRSLPVSTIRNELWDDNIHPVGVVYYKGLTLVSCSDGELVSLYRRVPVAKSNFEHYSTICCMSVLDATETKVRVLASYLDGSVYRITVPTRSYNVHFEKELWAKFPPSARVKRITVSGDRWAGIKNDGTITVGSIFAPSAGLQWNVRCDSAILGQNGLVVVRQHTDGSDLVVYKDIYDKNRSP